MQSIDFPNGHVKIGPTLTQIQSIAAQCLFSFARSGCQMAGHKTLSGHLAGEKRVGWHWHNYRINSKDINGVKLCHESIQ